MKAILLMLLVSLGCTSNEPKVAASGAPEKVAPPIQSPRESDGASEPASLIRRYYEQIDSGDLRSAYALWARGGQASGKSFDDFAAGFAETSEARVMVGDSIRIEGAAGSQYAMIPVSVDASLKSGESQHFEGTYTLRRSMVDGATPEQRTWRIESAELRKR
ncbi:MAG TPA: hypothetical protein VJL35_06880 [Gemmatimonadaceae bacterium]|nr:hypothetical protein [Gemmatimonadaceae bacterium]